MWYIIPHIKTKISRTRVHTCTRTDFFFNVALYCGVTQVGIRNSLRSNNHISVSTITYSPTSGEFALHQVKNMVMKRDKANTTLLMAAAESGSKATFEASLDAAKNHASGEVFVHMI